MTDADKYALSARIAAAAEKAGLPQELVWDERLFCTSCRAEAIFINQRRAMAGDKCPLCRSPVKHPPLDLTDPAVLLPLVKAWRDKNRPARTWGIEVDADETIARVWGAEGHCENWRVAPDDDPMEALARAFEAALRWEATND